MTLALTSGNKNFALYTGGAIDATGTNSSESAPAAEYLQCTVQVVWASITGTTTFKLTSSNNDSNYDDIPGASATTSGGSGSTSIHLTYLPAKFLKLTITSAAGAGTLTPTFAMKR